MIKSIILLLSVLVITGPVSGTKFQHPLRSYQLLFHTNTKKFKSPVNYYKATLWISQLNKIVHLAATLQIVQIINQAFFWHTRHKIRHDFKMIQGLKSGSIHTVSTWNIVKDLRLQLPLRINTQIRQLVQLSATFIPLFRSVGSVPKAPAYSLRQAACNLPASCEITERQNKWDLNIQQTKDPDTFSQEKLRSN